ncbi:cystine/glutamate transporter-like [Anneissia japonica]|uniref:cystine/glutamate transporter-like n=1 Tax=Anneissia japonica TaxID=1529436 RepID=UPI001425A33C|nr:cystine/glutamate transporter-like [Anneissia japonica]
MEPVTEPPIVAAPESNFSKVKEDKNASKPVHLVRRLGLAECVSITIGTVIGSGIFISPKGTLLNTGSLGVSMIVWALCGVLSTLGALSYGELGTTFTKSGGDYTYLLESYGPMVAFLRIWTFFVAVRTGSVAVVTLTAATYLQKIFIQDCQDLPYISVRLFAAVIIVIIFYLNCVSVPWTARVQVILTVAKVLGIVLIIITGFVIICKGYISSRPICFQ